MTKHRWRVVFRNAFGNPTLLECENCGTRATPSMVRRGIGQCKGRQNK